MKELKTKTVKFRLDEYELNMLNTLTRKFEFSKSKMIRYLIEKEYIEQNEKENW